jgi:hypothetical protein
MKNCGLRIANFGIAKASAMGLNISSLRDVWDLAGKPTVGCWSGEAAVELSPGRLRKLRRARTVLSTPKPETVAATKPCAQSGRRLGGALGMGKKHRAALKERQRLDCNSRRCGSFSAVLFAHTAPMENRSSALSERRVLKSQTQGSAKPPPWAKFSNGFAVSPTGCWANFWRFKLFHFLRKRNQNPTGSGTKSGDAVRYEMLVPTAKAVAYSQSAILRAVYGEGLPYFAIRNSQSAIVHLGVSSP